MIIRNMRHDDQAVQEQMRADPSMRKGRPRKYTFLQLDEALKLAKQIGLKNASEQTGINREAISEHGERERLHGPVESSRAKRVSAIQKYSDDKKKLCIRKALEFRANTKDPLYKCFARAAAYCGLEDPKAGMTIYKQYQAGTIAI